MNYEDIITGINNQEGFIKHNNIKVTSLNSDVCHMEVTINHLSLNPYGTAHGGLLFGLCDTACGVLAFANGKKAVTLNSTIDYLRPANGNLKCVAKCIKDGKTVGVYEAYVMCDDKEVVRSTVTMYYTK